jgi:hypothetical protein
MHPQQLHDEILRRLYEHQRPCPVKEFSYAGARWHIVKHGMTGKNSHGHPSSNLYASINLEAYKRHPFDLRIARWYKTIEEAVKGVLFYAGTCTALPSRDPGMGGSSEGNNRRDAGRSWGKESFAQRRVRMVGESHD